MAAEHTVFVNGAVHVSHDRPRRQFSGGGPRGSMSLRTTYDPDYFRKVFQSTLSAGERCMRSELANCTNGSLLQILNIRGDSPEQDAIRHVPMETAKINWSSSFDV
ncbi:hypothetical protein EVAR_37831_1 [Eumeta japonica]|uniref:Uncharacterized protein n=1 Tax=Eumeta variegata TaxID=151549 RepID=A0A4C1X2F4_EUMVA|nr:hypothetical protein EVAR_37831_1 [Eumeta japonica]